MSEAVTKKFTFDTEFRVEGDLISNAARARQRKVMTQEEIDQMCARARTEGMKAGQVRATEAVAAAIDNVSNVVRRALEESRTEIALLREEAAKLAFTAARKLAPIAVDAQPVADVEEALREAMHQSIGEPRIVLRASEKVIAAIKDKLDEIAHDEGFEGRVVASAEPGITGADCRVEWRGGGAERNIAALETAIGEVITRHFSQSASQTKG